jgi:hypothetical protein
LEWLGYGVRMEDFRIPKEILNAKLNKNWKMGRPKWTWFVTSRMV